MLVGDSGRLAKDHSTRAAIINPAPPLTQQSSRYRWTENCHEDPMHNPTFPLQELLNEVRKCTLCAAALPLGTNPVLQAQQQARVLIAGRPRGSAYICPESRLTMPVAIVCAARWGSTARRFTLRMRWPSCRWLFAIWDRINRAICRPAQNAQKCGASVC